MAERKTVVLTEEAVKSAFESDSSLGELVNPGVISLFEGNLFTPVESGGWRGVGGFYGESTAMGRVLVHAPEFKIDKGRLSALQERLASFIEQRRLKDWYRLIR